jgi:hypothetical protein
MRGMAQEHAPDTLPKFVNPYAGTTRKTARDQALGLNPSYSSS